MPELSLLPYYYLGHGISYSRIQEVDTALCLHKLASQTEDSVALPEQILPYIPTTLSWDNINHLEEQRWALLLEIVASLSLPLFA